VERPKRRRRHLEIAALTASGLRLPHTCNPNDPDDAEAPLIHEKGALRYWVPTAGFGRVTSDSPSPTATSSSL
jgi:hypothetical protein